MKKSELKQLIREVVMEMAKENPLLSLSVEQKHVIYTKKLQELQKLIQTHLPDIDTSLVKGDLSMIPDGEEHNPDYDSDGAPSLSIHGENMGSGYVKFLQDGKYTLWDEYDAVASGNAAKILTKIKKLNGFGTNQ